MSPPVRLDSLPQLMRDYVAAVLPEHPQRATGTRLTQRGEMVMKPGGRTLRFDAVEELAADGVAFVWRARFPILGPLALRVTDSYEPPDGLLEVRALGIPLQRKRGPEMAVGEAFRYLAEIPWVPPAVLANRELEWHQVDERTVEVATAVAGERIALQLAFEGSEIVRTVADRPRLEAGGALTQWIGEYREYRSFDGVRVPAHGEVRWELPHGPFNYWRGTILAVEPLP